ncbi:MAG: T9SS type A sorting domain-containing protein [Candidatus Cloacimonetes bacterium]|nr:T9SS type A sorting domain-containing protein [Candidatus Cloacimonadota bacterium]
MTVDPTLPISQYNKHDITQAINSGFTNPYGNTLINLSAGDFGAFAACPSSRSNRVVKVVGTRSSDTLLTRVITSYPTVLAKIYDSSPMQNNILILEDIAFEGNMNGVEVDYNTTELQVFINNCSFTNNYGWSIRSHIPLTITNCTFNMPIQHFNFCHGAISLTGGCNCSHDMTATIRGNTFTGRFGWHTVELGAHPGSAPIAGWHYLRAAIVEDNIFNGTYCSSAGNPYPYGNGAVQASGVQTLSFKRNIFATKSEATTNLPFQLRIYDPYRMDGPLESRSLEVLNNSFVTDDSQNYISAMGIDKRFYTARIINNVISDMDGVAIQFYSNPITAFDYYVQNNIIYNCSDDIVNAGTGDGWIVSGQIASDPQLDVSRKPIWNSAIFSPCIDAGNRDTNGNGIPWSGGGGFQANDPEESDFDGTPLDIGAKRALPHQFEDYSMPAGGAIKWMSFPVVNDLTVGLNQNGSFFAPILYPEILDWVDWKKEDEYEARMAFTGYNLYNYTAEVESPVGYKVKLQNSVSQEIPLPTPGFLADPDTQIHLYKYLAGTTTPNENWIGYFHGSSVYPLDAFAQILNYVTSIRTQYWSMVKDPKTGAWAVSLGNLTLNYGDMVIVTVNQDCSFRWNYSIPVDPKLREKASAFSFEERADYTPLFVDMTDLQDLPSELGIYVDGVCKGAVTVDGNYTDICVYLEDNQIMDAENTELVLHYNSKSAIGQRRSFKPGAGELTRHTEPGLSFYTLQLSEESELDNMAPVTQLLQNYPNPFNPSTTIAYELATDGPVCLEIFNVRGQRVATLVNKRQTSGLQKLIWDGKDDNGRLVGSGVYHYRLRTENGSITQKMLLLK